MLGSTGECKAASEDVLEDADKRLGVSQPLGTCEMTTAHMVSYCDEKPASIRASAVSASMPSPWSKSADNGLAPLLGGGSSNTSELTPRSWECILIIAKADQRGAQDQARVNPMTGNIMHCIPLCVDMQDETPCRCSC